MKKTIFSFILLAVLVVGLVACDPDIDDDGDSELAPVLNITSQKDVVIGLEDTYTLAYTTQNASSVSVTVSEKDGGTAGSYAEATKVFSATAGGEYTLTIVATNVVKTTTDTVRIVVNTVLPIITFESGALDEYEVNQGVELELPSATAKDAQDVALTVSVTVDSNDAEISLVAGKHVFVADAAGTYVVTYFAEDTYGNEKTETISVMVIPTSDPVINFQAGKLDTYEAEVGELIVLPSATAKDGLNQDVIVEVFPTLQRGVVFAENENQTFNFTALVAGSHLVSYYAEDVYGNYVEEFIEVIVSPSNEETELSEAENQIANLNTSGLTYRENFVKGYNSDLAKGIVWDGAVKVSVQGHEDALDGNSLIFDYSDATATTNTQIFFGALDDYLKSGRWEISFDVKVIEGNIPGFYVSFIFEGDNSGDNLGYTINPTGTTRVVYNHIKAFDSTKTWYFRLFTYTGDGSFNYNGLKIALDNFEFKWTEVVDPTVQRSGTPKAITPEMLDAGYTLTGTDDNYSSVSGSGNPTWVEIDKLVAGDILNSEQQALLTAANGFNSDYAIRATTQQVYFDSLRGLLTDPNYMYTVTYKVYAPSGGGWYFWISKEDTGQALAQGLSDAAGVKTFTHTFFGNPQYYHVGLYSGSIQELLIGDITVSRELYVPSETTPNGHEVGKTWTVDSFLQETAEGSTISIGDGIFLSSIAGFDKSVMKHIDSSSSSDRNVVAFNGSSIFENVGTYKVTLTLYVVTLSDGPLMVNIDNQVFSPLTLSGTGLMEVEYEVSGRTLNFFSLYTQNATLSEIYLASISIELMDIN